MASVKILGTACWKKCQAHTIQKKIQRICTVIQILKHLSLTTPQIAPRLAKRIARLRAERRELKLALKNVSISFLDLPCLLFDHPDSNAWKSCVNIVRRVCSLQDRFHPIADRPIPKIPQASFAHLALGTISLLGTSASLLRQIGVADEDHLLSQTLIGAAFAVQAVETCVLIRNSIANWLLKNRPEKDRSQNDFKCSNICER